MVIYLKIVKQTLFSANFTIYKYSNLMVVSIFLLVKKFNNFVLFFFKFEYKLLNLKEMNLFCIFFKKNSFLPNSANYIQT